MLRPIRIDRDSPLPHYRQISEQIIDQIQQGYLQSGARLPSSRLLSQQLGIHRKSIVHAYEELQLMDWIYTATGRGTFVSDDLPDIGPKKLTSLPETGTSSPTVDISLPDYMTMAESVTHLPYHLDDGLPDPRLIPFVELERAWKSALRRGNQYHRLGYASPQGLPPLREAIADYLSRTRGLMVTADHILLTRGVTHAFHLALTAMVKPGDKVIVPELNWANGNNAIRFHGGSLLKARIDEKGLNTDHVEELMVRNDVRMIYLTPHHQYPTTLIMPAARRIQLLELARKHGVYVFEDDYDFDFHYGNVPIMPLASARHDGLLLYAGSFTKAISPAFRVGYLVGDPALINELTKIRRIVDRQGDPTLEHALLELFRLDVLPRSLRRARGLYQKRRDVLASLLAEQLGDRVSFKVPDGGMAIWTKFAPEINLTDARQRAHRLGLSFSDGAGYGREWNATRLGFASSNEEELEEAVRILRNSLAV
ncbi:aminotransferase-like domain-containing protein [Neolewinella agarilytica]|uniref:Transcriptional regulator, GntR family n=1 Tax=Neolewinella agarilytica TaxID=478744 RepID=A0A1H9CG03_9BACT|nr:PLP-dependent aminotransferase family protein [Neolewinella agarilytica]SEP99568.1 transcriptional regulator, GntR family [Neolewinella agarilytica]